MSAYLIGIDGGGSKTDFLLCDLGLNGVARCYYGSSNPNDIGTVSAAELLTDGVNSLCASAGIEKSEVAAVFAGIAGATSRKNVAVLTEALRKALPCAKAAVLHDGINVLYGAFPDSDGVSVICGTGSSCFVKKGGEIFRIGGYGSLDLCGNGYEIGRAALAHALKTVDGREQEGVMEELLHKKFGNDFLRSLETMLELGKKQTASLAPLVFEAAERGDRSALAIIKTNVEYIVGLIDKAGEKFEGDYGVAIAGGIFKSALAEQMLKANVNRRAKITKNAADPVFGAAARAKQLLTESL